MRCFSLIIGTFALTAALVCTSAASVAQTVGATNAGACGTSITGCGNVGQTVVSSSNGCTAVDDGNVDDPPAPGILSFDGDKDDGQIISQCPQLAPALVPPAPVTAASCRPAPPGIWYDPQSSVYGVPSVAGSWTQTANSIGSSLFKMLFLFEIFMLGLQAVLYRHDITHLFSTFAFKTFLVTFFIYLMSMSPTFLPQVFGSFQIAGQSVGGSTGNNITAMNQQAEAAAGLFFCAAMASHIEDRETALEYGAFGLPGPLGSGDIGHTFQGAIGHITFEFLVQGLGMLVIVGEGIMFLSLAVITGESYITMFAGAFFLGFSSLRFTMPFTQGYLSYAVNVGVKMFTYWVLIDIESSFLMPVLMRAGTGLINAASIQFGPGAEMYLVPAAVDVAQIVAMGALTWFLPSIAGRYISGRSGVSAANIISGLASSLKGGALNPAGPSGGMMPGPMSPAQLFRGPVRVRPSSERFTAVTAPPSAMAPFAGFMRTATSTIASSFASLPPPIPASAHVSRANELMNTDPSKQVVQASVADGPDPFAIKPKAAEMLVRAPVQKHDDRRGVKAPIDETPVNAPAPPNANSAQPASSSPGFNQETLHASTPSSRQTTVAAGQDAKSPSPALTRPPSKTTLASPLSSHVLEDDEDIAFIRAASLETTTQNNELFVLPNTHTPTHKKEERGATDAGAT